MGDGFKAVWGSCPCVAVDECVGAKEGTAAVTLPLYTVGPTTHGEDPVLFLPSVPSLLQSLCLPRPQLHTLSIIVFKGLIESLLNV